MWQPRKKNSPPSVLPPSVTHPYRKVHYPPLLSSPLLSSPPAGQNCHVLIRDRGNYLWTRSLIFRVINSRARKSDRCSFFSSLSLVLNAILILWRLTLTKRLFSLFFFLTCGFFPLFIAKSLFLPELLAYTFACNERFTYRMILKMDEFKVRKNWLENLIEKKFPQNGEKKYNEFGIFCV